MNDRPQAPRRWHEDPTCPDHIRKIMVGGRDVEELSPSALRRIERSLTTARSSPGGLRLPKVMTPFAVLIFGIGGAVAATLITTSQPDLEKENPRSEVNKPRAARERDLGASEENKITP